MDEADFAALSEHLEEVRPIFDRFCISHRFVYVEGSSLGRYPRIRIERPSVVDIWFDLWMELDASGRRVEQFNPELPYELGAGACIVVPGGSKHGTRLQKAIQCFHGRPFRQVAGVLREQMEEYLPVLETWDEVYLRNNGMHLVLC